MSQHKKSNSAKLELPRKSVELEDPGAHELSSEGEEYFSDASEGQSRKKISRPVTPSSPIPSTRIEKVDDEPSYGEVPGTEAYEKRRGDAVPDDVQVISQGQRRSANLSPHVDVPSTPGGTPIPRTVVEKIDPDEPGYGDVPGTMAYEKRLADATPDVILKNPMPERGAKYKADDATGQHSSTLPVPETVVIRADGEPADAELSDKTAAAELRKTDTAPDRTETSRDESESEATLFDTPPSSRRRPTMQDSDDDVGRYTTNDDNDLADDFDDFEEGAREAEDGNDDFGDFDDFESGPIVVDDDDAAATPTVEKSRPVFEEQPPTFPLIDLAAMSSLPDFIQASQTHLDAMFPSTTSLDRTRTSSSVPLPDSVFPTERSASLWKQLITPPPLQPPNWTQSRIRRLFLISLGVPVDLDEVLPPSKQKKLILPDIDLPSSRMSTALEPDSIAKLKISAANDSNTSIDSQASGVNTKQKSRSARIAAKALPPPPPLDLNAVRQLCSTTNERLEGMEDEELEIHVRELEALTEGTSQVLEYWLKQRDGLRKEKEAFEGVIENLVKHAKRIRTFK